MRRTLPLLCTVVSAWLVTSGCAADAGLPMASTALTVSASADAKPGASAGSVFALLDRDGNGTLTPGELGGADISAIDADGDGSLNLAEVTNALSQVLRLGAESCKDNGWQQFGVFKNQGDCVSFFASIGRNGPAGD